MNFFNDPAVQEVAFHIITKVIAGAIIFIFWFYWFSNTLSNYFKAHMKADEEERESDKPFPIVSAVLMTLLTFGFFHYCSWEMAYRTVDPKPPALEIQRESHMAEEDENFVAPEFKSSYESFEEKSKEAVEKARISNEEAKKKFNDLPAAAGAKDE